MMNEKQQQIREERLKSYRRMMVAFAICFIVTPFLFWKTISRFHPTTLVIFFVFYALIFGSLFFFQLYRYKKMRRE